MVHGPFALQAPARATWLTRVRSFLGMRLRTPVAFQESRITESRLPAPPESTGFPLSALQAMEVPELGEAPRARYLAWLLAAEPAPKRPDPQGPGRVLAALDAELAAPKGCTRLLRRAPNVVPRLMEALRSDYYSSFEIAQHVEKDVVLMAEVMRVARSCIYSHYMQRRPTVAQAIDLLGSAGLNEVIARVLFRPLFNAPAGSRSFHVGNRVLEDANRCAGATVALSGELQVDPVDAHLAGLLQCAGWSALVRALELHGLLGEVHLDAIESAGFADALFARRDRMLAQLLLAWEVSPALTMLAQAIGAGAPWPPLLEALERAQAHVIVRRLDALEAVH
jgi:hypothetical protein